MEEELIQLGFTPMKYGWFQLTKQGFYIEADPGQKIFFIYTDKSGDRESAPYPYKSKEKLSAIIQAHEEYFK